MSQNFTSSYYQLTMDPSLDICNFYHVHEKKLGEGGFAKVRLATHLLTQQFVAIKCLDKIKLGPELPRIYNEIECLKKLKHKNIARLYQVFETPTCIYLVLEYCPGGELFDYIVKKSKLTESESAQIIFDLMRVLDFIHLNGFAHRDLKPENVLFDERHQIKLIDFGLTANCSPDNLASNANQAPMDQLNTCCGSVTYAAPEVIAGKLYKGTSVDVWSAGVMMYALLVGQLPFNDNSISKLYQKIQEGIKTLPPFLSQDACDLIRKMLTVDPEERITVREVLLHPWLRNRTVNTTRINRRLDFNSGQLDEQIFKKCCEMFPQIQQDELRGLIQADFNYYSTAYHLLHAKCPPRTYGVIGAKRTPLPERPRAPIVALSENIHNYVTPVKKTRFVTVTNSPRALRTPPSYLSRLHEVNKRGAMTTPRRGPRPVGSKIDQQENVNRLSSVYFYHNKPKKSIVKRLLDTVTPSKLRQPRKRAKLIET